ncbi:LacI family DNA-binding transcriptional regulator [Planctomonas psychrotolerans]|uniref:LacI family DNA-binding transcriptional regulator n=1 Tax=Planctomonas psychrotolerans TaxID=2528712 RepID=UPI001D0D03D6|nr:LacI family DNA-binding transcriptional regulator [Planctomonas psychrotolerans]
MVTMQDVARAAGVSPMTVSNVLNGYPHVREDTRDKVLRAVDDLDYRVNVAARNLRAGRTKTIGFAVPEADRPYFGQLGAKIIAHAATRGYHVVIEQTGADRERELHTIAGSRNRMYDGLILSVVGLGTRDRDLLRTNFPMVILGERVFSGPADHIALPNTEGTYAATRHLIERGCRDIAMVKGNDDLSDASVTALRYDGFRRALRDSGLEHDPARDIAIEELTMAGGREGTMRLVDSGVRFDGVVCITDTVALGVIRGLVDAGVSVPGDARVIGFDGIDESEFSVPRLSTIAPDHDEVAARAVDLLLDRIAGGEDWQAQEFVASFRLIERESTV